MDQIARFDAFFLLDLCLEALQSRTVFKELLESFIVQTKVDIYT